MEAPKVPTATPALPSTFKASPPTTSRVNEPTQVAADAKTSAPQAPAASSAPAMKVEVVAPAGPTVAPEQAAPDGTNPSQYPADGTSLEGLMGGSGGQPVGGETVAAPLLDGNPPAYNAEAKHGERTEPTFPKRVVQHCTMDDFAVGDLVYKLGVSHPPYKVETVANGLVVLRAGTGGAVQITNNSEASFFTNDQSRQYGVADGNPNTSGDVKAP